jgi:hypothetical protein
MIQSLLRDISFRVPFPDRNVSDSDRPFLPKRKRNQRRTFLRSLRISLQNATHSLQIKTFGPAMSVRTSRWLLPQNEQYIVGSAMAVPYQLAGFGGTAIQRKESQSAIRPMSALGQ